MVWYWILIFPTHWVFSIPSPRLRDRKHTTPWIKIISHHKPWEILYTWTSPISVVFRAYLSPGAPFRRFSRWDRPCCWHDKCTRQRPARPHQTASDCCPTLHSGTSTLARYLKRNCGYHFSVSLTVCKLSLK